MYRTSLLQTRTYILLLVITFISTMRLFWLPGITFNGRNWDDEITWINESKSMSFINYIVFRDAPGYFVFVPRFIVQIAESVPSIGPFASMRIFVIFIQLLCFGAAISCVVKWRTQSTLWVVVFTAFSLTYIEDLNYVHNIGYLFIFPIYFFVFTRIAEEKSIRSYHLLISVLLISKPFTAVIVIFLVMFFYYNFKQSRIPLFFMGSYSSLYIAAYIFLPHRWETPFNLDAATLVKVLFDFPWILLSVIVPALSIGALGVLRLLDLPLMRDLVGVLVYFFISITFWRFRRYLILHLRQLSVLTKGLLIVFVINYCLVFSSSDSFWIKYFPLFTLESPQFLWARWSAVLPLVALVLIASLNSISVRLRIFIICFISSQWFLLSIFGQSWLRRYW